MKSFSHTTISLLLAIGISLLVWILLQFPLFSRLENTSTDMMQSLRYRINGAKNIPDPHIALIAIDDASQRHLGSWPFPRSLHGHLMGLLSTQNPKVVGWDILFTDTKAPPQSSGADPTNDPALAEYEQSKQNDDIFLQGISMVPHVVMCAANTVNKTEAPSPANLLPTEPFINVSGDVSKIFSPDYLEFPFPDLRKLSYFGLADLGSNNQGDVSRRMPMLIRAYGMILPSFSLQIVMQYLGASAKDVTIVLGKNISIPRQDGPPLNIPIDQNGSYLINYRDRLEDFHKQAYGYAGTLYGLSDKANNKDTDFVHSLPQFKDNIVVIGFTGQGFDSGPTPLDNNTAKVVLHLNILDNILKGDYLYPVSALIWIPVYGLLLFGFASLMFRVGISPMIPIGLFALIFIPFLSFCALYFGNYLAPVAIPDLGMLLLAGAIPTRRYFGEEREKMRVKAAMRAYLSEKIMNKVLAHPDNLNLGGVKQEISIMFCDIRGFTSYCDERDPHETVVVLNEYMELMTQVVFKYDGTIDKYIGDCIMAFWNAPELQPDHAQRAVCCAIEMRYALAQFKTQRVGLDRELFECGIGIHTGEALVGNMGSSLKRNYTAMGSTVNLAARLETMTKRLNERIAISEDTLRQLHGEFPITDRGLIEIPGFAKPVHVYAVNADQDIQSALTIAQKLGQQMSYTAAEVTQPIWAPAPLPEDADPNP